MASETLRRLVALEHGQDLLRQEVAGTNARLDLVVIRLDQMLEILRHTAVVRAEFDALERRVRTLEHGGTR